MSNKFYPVSISFACNNPDNGMPEGKFSDVHIGDQLLELANKYYPPKCPTLLIEFEKEIDGGWGPSKGKGHVKIHQKGFPIVGYKPHWGNWCWDVVVVSPVIARHMIDYLKSLDWFQCEGGVEGFYDNFNRDGPFEWSADLIKLLESDGYQRP